jgi:hypothetical protein
MNYHGERPVGEGTSVSANPGIDGTGKFPAYTILNGAITLGNFDLIPQLSMQFVCNNITDIEYFDPGIRSADGGFYSYRTPQHMRNFVLRLIYEY